MFTPDSHLFYEPMLAQWDGLTTTEPTDKATADEVAGGPIPLAELRMALRNTASAEITRLAAYIYTPNGAEYSIEYWVPPHC